MPNHASFATRLVLTVLGLAVSAFGCTEMKSPTSPAPLIGAASGAMEFMAHSAASGEATLPIGAELAAVREATAWFHEINEAYAAGYTTENEPCVSSPAGAMGVHAPNLALSFDPALDPLRPEVLLYLPAPNGKYRLLGVEYTQAVLLRNLETGQVAPRFEPTAWDPSKYEVVNPQPQLLGHSFHLTPPPASQVPWIWTLHVWVWAHNPAGMFAEWNPAISCD